MTPLEVATILLVATVAGMLIALSIDAVLLGVYVKVPGRECARYWAAGSALILIATVTFLSLGGRADILLESLIVGAFILGHVLQWRGLQIFFFRQRDRLAWPAAAAFAALYLFLLYRGAAYEWRLACLSLVPLIVWPACMREVLRDDRGRRHLSSQLALVGLGLMMAAASFDIVAVFSSTLEAVLVGSPHLRQIMEMLVPLLGAILYLTGLVLMYFDRVAAHTNYAASHDELTGLLNRRAVMAAGRRELDLQRRLQQPLVVGFLDIDHFKRINDTYGHDMGDLVLRESARVLQECCRNVDLVGRYGGEEFCLVFPGDHHGGAQVVGERLVKAFRSHVFDGYPEKVTVSVGLVPVDTQSDQLDWDKILQLADIELYKAKQNGRDNFSVFGQDFRRRHSGGHQSDPPSSHSRMSSGLLGS